MFKSGVISKEEFDKAKKILNSKIGSGKWIEPLTSGL